MPLPRAPSAGPTLTHPQTPPQTFRIPLALGRPDVPPLGYHMHDLARRDHVVLASALPVSHVQTVPSALSIYRPAPHTPMRVTDVINDSDTYL